MTGKLRMCTAIAGNRLRLERRAGEALLVIAPFGAIALLIIPMAVGTDVPLLRQVGPGMYWVVLLLFGVMVILRQSSHQTPAQARLLTLAGVPGAVRMLGNAIATTVLLLGFGAVLAPVAVLLYDPVLAGWAWFLALLPGVATGLALLGVIADTLVHWIHVRSTLGPLLIVPLALPLLLGATQVLEAVAFGRSPLPWLLLIATVDLILLLAVLFAGHFLE
ncbi:MULTISPECIES: heme exporter protein CcmB [Bacteria]